MFSFSLQELKRINVPFTSVTTNNDHFTMIEELDEDDNKCMGVKMNDVICNLTDLLHILLY